MKALRDNDDDALRHEDLVILLIKQKVETLVVESQLCVDVDSVFEDSSVVWRVN
jgi:hypothetical protein